MIMVRFRSEDEHRDLLKKVKKMKEYTEMIEECLEEAMEEDDLSYRSSGNYRKEYEEEDMHMRGGRYGYRRGGMR